MNIHSIYSVAASSILCIQSELSEKSLPAFEIFPLIGNSQLLQQLSRPGVKAQIILSSNVHYCQNFNLPITLHSSPLPSPNMEYYGSPAQSTPSPPFYHAPPSLLPCKATSAIYCLKGAFALRMWFTYNEHIFSTFHYFRLLFIPSLHQLWSSWSTQAVAPTAWQTVRTSMHPPAFQPYGDLRNSSDENACEIDN